MNLLEIINSKKNNIGSLCLYINKRSELKEELDSFINYTGMKLVEKIWCYLNNNKDIFCDCGKIKKWNDFKNGWRITCGEQNCVVSHRKKTNLIIYGVDNPMKNETVKKKTFNTNIEKYGFNSPMKNDVVKKTFSNSMKNRTVEKKGKTKLKVKETWNKKTESELMIIRDKKKQTNLNKSEKEKEEIKRKREQTCIDKYGVKYAIVSEPVREKILIIFNDKYGGNTPYADKNLRLKSAQKYTDEHIKYIKEHIGKFQCEYISHENKNKNGCNIEYTLKCLRTNKLFTISYTNLRIRILKNIEISPFFRKKYGSSEEEEELFNFIKDNYDGEILRNKKRFIKPKELDIYLPDLKLAFEYNGLYFHDEICYDNDYHLMKTESCEKMDIQLIHVFSDLWLYKTNIVKSHILNLLGKTPNKIYGTKCDVKEITDSEIIKDFLEMNHLQGFISSKIKLGLYYKEELVSLMTFKKQKKDTYNLLRFCNKLNIEVIDAADKLFKYFIEKYNPLEVISNVDRSWSQGELYYNLGFDLVHKTKPNYYYVVDDIRQNRFNYRKDKLVHQGFDPNESEHEIMLERNIFRIYDSGSLKFIWKN